MHFFSSDTEQYSFCYKQDKKKEEKINLLELADIIFVDTSPFMEMNFTETKGHNYD